MGKPPAQAWMCSQGLPAPATREEPVRLVAEPDLSRRQGRSCDGAPSRIGKPLARVDKPGAPSARSA